MLSANIFAAFAGLTPSVLAFCCNNPTLAVAPSTPTPILSNSSTILDAVAESRVLFNTVMFSRLFSDKTTFLPIASEYSR